MAEPRARRPRVASIGAGSPSALGDRASSAVASGGPAAGSRDSSRRSRARPGGRRDAGDRPAGGPAPDGPGGAGRASRRPGARGGPARAGAHDSAERGSASAGEWLRGIRFSGFSLVMLGILVVAVLVLAPTVGTLLDQHRQIVALQRSIASEQHDVAAMKAARARWNDPSYIRAQARDRLLYVMPGETSYLVIDDRPAAQKASGGSDARTSTTPIAARKDWLAQLAGSAVTAGTTDAPPSSLPTDPASTGR